MEDASLLTLWVTHLSFAAACLPVSTFCGLLTRHVTTLLFSDLTWRDLSNQSQKPLSVAAFLLLTVWVIWRETRLIQHSLLWNREQKYSSFADLQNCCHKYKNTYTMAVKPYKYVWITRGHDLFIRKHHSNIDARKFHFCNRVINVHLPSANAFKKSLGHLVF